MKTALEKLTPIKTDSLYGIHYRKEQVKRVIEGLEMEIGFLKLDVQEAKDKIKWYEDHVVPSDMVLKGPPPNGVIELEVVTVLKKE